MTIMVREKFVIKHQEYYLLTQCARAQHRTLNTKALTRVQGTIHMKQFRTFNAILRKKNNRNFQPPNYDPRVEQNTNLGIYLTILLYLNIFRTTRADHQMHYVFAI